MRPSRLYRNIEAFYPIWYAKCHPFRKMDPSHCSLGIPEADFWTEPTNNTLFYYIDRCELLLGAACSMLFCNKKSTIKTSFPIKIDRGLNCSSNALFCPIICISVIADDDTRSPLSHESKLSFKGETFSESRLFSWRLFFFSLFCNCALKRIIILLPILCTFSHCRWTDPLFPPAQRLSTWTITFQATRHR